MSAHLGAAKPLLAVTGLLLASLAGNALQLHGRIEASAECRAQREAAAATAQERGRRLAAEETANRTAQVAAAAVEEREKLLADLRAIADRGQQTRTVYRDRIREIPAATCAPGAERMDAANSAIGGAQ
jgi:hypothetical protein